MVILSGVAGLFPFNIRLPLKIIWSVRREPCNLGLSIAVIWVGAIPDKANCAVGTFLMKIGMSHWLQYFR